MKLLPSFRSWLLGVSLLPLLWLAGCGGALPPIPDNAAVARTPPDAAAIFNACLAAHGGRAAYARLHDVNVRFDSHWASVGPKLQPVLSDTGYRQGSEEKYVPVKDGFIVTQLHKGPKGAKSVNRIPPDEVSVEYEELVPADRWMLTDYNGEDKSIVRPPHNDEVKAAAGIVTDAYAMFLWGPYFFVQRMAKFQKLATTAELNGQPCDELLTILHPGFGVTPEDKVILFIGQRDHLLHRVQFTLNALESTRGAEVHLDLSVHERIAGVMWPTSYLERIDRPVNLPAHRWSLLSLTVNHGLFGEGAIPAGGKPH